MSNTLTPAEATQIVTNGGLVVASQKVPINLWSRDTRTYCIDTWDNFREFPFTESKIPHHLYDPTVFARAYPCTLPGPEAKALLMAAPVGMLWGDYIIDNSPFSERDAEWWTGTEFTGQRQECFSWKYRAYEIRLRPGWLESQRAKFARGEFGEVEAQAQLEKDNPMYYLINGKPIIFPWQGSGPECVEIWNHAPKGMLEFNSGACTREWFRYTPLGHKEGSVYRLRIRADYVAPKPGDVVDAERAWELCKAGWVVKMTHVATEWALFENGIFYVGSKRLGFPLSKFEAGPWVAVRHEPWRTATLDTGHVWSGQDAAQALRAGMEGQEKGNETETWARITNGVLMAHTPGETPWEVDNPETMANHNNWALRWPEENVEMETNDETLTAGQALDAVIAGETFTCIHGSVFSKDSMQAWTAQQLLNSAPFRRVPKRPTSKILTLGDGLEVVVYADKVEADVQGCGKWTSTKRSYDIALRLEGLEGEVITGFAVKDNKEPFGGTTIDVGVIVSSKTITFSDIRRVLAAMSEMGGGE